MKVDVNRAALPRTGAASEVLSRCGDMGLAADGRVMLAVSSMTHNKVIVDLNDPHKTYSGSCSIIVTKLEPGTKITLTVE